MRHTSSNPCLAKIGAKYDKIEFADFIYIIFRLNQDFQKLTISRKKCIESMYFFSKV